jgi:hypothetical protein
MDFDREGPNNLPLIRGLCLVQRTLTTKGLNDLPLIGGLCLLQRTLTAKGLNDLPLVGGLCLVQRTSTTKSLNDLPLIEGLCLVPMTDFNHDGSQDTNRSKPNEQQCIQGIKRMYYLDEGGKFCIGHLVNARMITVLG